MISHSAYHEPHIANSEKLASLSPFHQHWRNAPPNKNPSTLKSSFHVLGQAPTMKNSHHLSCWWIGRRQKETNSFKIKSLAETRKEFLSKNANIEIKHPGKLVYLSKFSWQWSERESFTFLWYAWINNFLFMLPMNCKDDRRKLKLTLKLKSLKQSKQPELLELKLQS